ncbi:MAG: 5-(carboxyamino)imidazole ribonucleotide synthase [Propionibacteriales bacterium]|nr:5-(carboxyamino)imidazole ribonucleotide synthase [Propionibacteriales bacterium]
MSSPSVGVVGAGQLARMMQQAAIGLGVPLKLLAETADGSAAQVIVDTTVGDYTDWGTLSAWVKGAHVITFDHEHVPTAHLERLLADGIACRPGPAALVHAQDKAVMRNRLAQLNVGQPRFRLVRSAADVSQAAASLGDFPLVLKTARGGYDGKGVWTVAVESEAAAVLSQAPQGVQMLAEERVDFKRELSALVVRSPSGQVAAYPVVESVQRDGICVEVTAPAPDLDPELAVQAQQTAMRIAAELGVEGLLAVEMFQTNDGRVLVNELAMRPHNTGHWSIDGAVTCQFENHLRAVLDLPLGSPMARARWTVMVNILGGVGDLFDGYPHVQARDPAVRVHLYGKSVRPGRKVGHVTAYGDDLEQVRERARHAAGWFAGTVR